MACLQHMFSFCMIIVIILVKTLKNWVNIAREIYLTFHRQVVLWMIIGKYLYMALNGLKVNKTRKLRYFPALILLAIVLTDGIKKKFSVKFRYPDIFRYPDKSKWNQIE